GGQDDEGRFGPKRRDPGPAGYRHRHVFLKYDPHARLQGEAGVRAADIEGVAVRLLLDEVAVAHRHPRHRRLDIVRVDADEVHVVAAGAGGGVEEVSLRSVDVGGAGGVTRERVLAVVAERGVAGHAEP